MDFSNLVAKYEEWIERSRKRTVYSIKEKGGLVIFYDRNSEEEK